MNIGQWVIRHRWPVIVASVLLLVSSAYGLKYLGFESDNRIFFGPDNPELKALEAFENTYTRMNTVFFVVEAPEGDVFTPETLSAIEVLTRRSWQIPYSGRVDSITNFQHTSVSGDELIVADLVSGAEGLSPDELKEARRIALSEPMLAGRLVSDDGRVAGVFVTILVSDDIDVVKEVSDFSKALAADFERENPGLNLYLSGGVIFDNAIAEVSQSDMGKLIPIMMAVMVLAIYLSLRSVSATVSTVIVIVASAVTGMGLAGWLGYNINTASAMAPVIILTLAVADSIHVLLATFDALGSGRGKDEAIVESLRVNLQPVFLTSITTAIGFLSMNFSDAPPFHDLGNIVAIGVMAAFFYSILLLPALTSLLPVGSTKEQRCICSHAVASAFGDFVVKRQGVLLVSMSSLMLVLAFGITRIELNDNFIEYFDEELKIRKHTNFVIENLTGLDVVEFSVPSGEDGGINDPAYLRNVEEFANWFRAEPGILHVTAITDILKRLNRDMHGGDPAYYTVPEERDLAAQYLFLYEMSLPFGLDLNDRIDVGKSATRLTALLDDMSASEWRELEVKSNAWVEANLPERMRSPATGVTLIFAHISERNINGMLVGTALALVLISAILVFALRSPAIGVLSLVPNLAPALMAFGLWGLVVGQVGLAVAVVSALSLGIVVDDTVHFLSKYLRARRELGFNAEDAVRHSFKTVGAAITATSVILTSGFLVLAFSGFKVNSSMGLLTAIAIGFALVADLLFLPPLLMRFARKRRRDLRTGAYI